MRKPAESDINVHAIAAECLGQAGGDVRSATELMVTRVASDWRLWEALTEDLISGACYDAIRKVCQQERRKVWLAPNYDAAQQGGRVVHLASGNLLMFPLPGGMYLRDAQRGDVENAAVFYDTQARNMASKAAWLGMIAERLDAHRTVGDVLSEDELRAMQEAVATL